jgi:Flp pilus assembly protein TadB
MKRRKLLFSEFTSGFFAITVILAILLRRGMEIPTGAIFVLAGCAIILAVFSFANRRKRKEIEEQKAAIENAKEVIKEEDGSLDTRDKYYWR